MRKSVIALNLAVFAAIGVLSISSAATSTGPTIVMPDDLKWSPVKGLTGAEQAVLWGDPDKAGSLYTMRLKLVDGVKANPHWHPNDERVTVLSGTLMFGVGAKMDAAKMATLPAGSFIFIPAHVNHYAMAKGETLLQTSGVGPFEMNPAK